jgi:TolA-binding protein
MKKQVTAFVAAIFITLCIALGIFAVSGVAFANSNGAQASNVPGQSASTTVNASNVVSQTQIQQQQQIQQLQNLVAQYQQRDQQYQQREQQYQNQISQSNTQLTQAQQQLQQYQSLVTALEQRGLITVTGDGQVYINR